MGWSDKHDGSPPLIQFPFLDNFTSKDAIELGSLNSPNTSPINLPPNPSPIRISTTISPSSTNTPETTSSTSHHSLSFDDTLPKKFRVLQDIYESCTFALMVSNPINFEEVARKEEWCKAMEDEIMAIEKNDTWVLTDFPTDKFSIGLKWVFKTKYNADGSVQKYKARLVAKGYSQQQGIDFQDTFSPVARFETVRTYLALAAQLHWHVYHLNVNPVFLNGELEEEVYVIQPEGFIVQGKEEKVYRLVKALYRLKQALRAWYSKIDSFFQENGFQKSENDPTLYVKKKVKHGEDNVFVSQRKYAEDLLKRFHMINCKSAITSMNVNEKLQLEDVSRFMYNPTKQHFGAAKRIFHYIARTADCGIWYSHVSNLTLIGFTDSDWVGSVDDRKSTSGHVFSLRTGAITWSSKKQVITTLSSAEAE